MPHPTQAQSKMNHTNAFFARVAAEAEQIKQFYSAHLSTPEIQDNEGNADNMPREITLTYRVGLSEAAEVIIDLNEAGEDDDGRLSFDMSINVGNDDSVGPVYMHAALGLVLESFYEQGLHTRWGRIIGD